MARFRSTSRMKAGPVSSISSSSSSPRDLVISSSAPPVPPSVPLPPSSPVPRSPFKRAADLFKGVANLLTGSKKESISTDSSSTESASDHNDEKEEKSEVIQKPTEVNVNTEKESPVIQLVIQQFYNQSVINKKIAETDPHGQPFTFVIVYLPIQHRLLTWFSHFGPQTADLAQQLISLCLCQIIGAHRLTFVDLSSLESVRDQYPKIETFSSFTNFDDFGHINRKQKHVIHFKTQARENSERVRPITKLAKELILLQNAFVFACYRSQSDYLGIFYSPAVGYSNKQKKPAQVLLTNIHNLSDKLKEKDSNLIDEEAVQQATILCKQFEQQRERIKVLWSNYVQVISISSDSQTDNINGPSSASPPKASVHPSAPLSYPESILLRIFLKKCRDKELCNTGSDSTSVSYFLARMDVLDEVLDELCQELYSCSFNTEIAERLVAKSTSEMHLSPSQSSSEMHLSSPQTLSQQPARHAELSKAAKNDVSAHLDLSFISNKSSSQSEMHLGAPVEASEMHLGAPVEASEMHLGAPVEASEMHPRAPVETSLSKLNSNNLGNPVAVKKRKIETKGNENLAINRADDQEVRMSTEFKDAQSCFMDYELANDSYMAAAARYTSSLIYEDVKTSSSATYPPAFVIISQSFDDQESSKKQMNEDRVESVIRFLFNHPALVKLLAADRAPIILHPFHVGDVHYGHWILLAYYIDSNTIVYFDSIKESVIDPKAPKFEIPTNQRLQVQLQRLWIIGFLYRHRLDDSWKYEQIAKEYQSGSHEFKLVIDHYASRLSGQSPSPIYCDVWNEKHNGQSPI